MWGQMPCSKPRSLCRRPLYSESNGLFDAVHINWTPSPESPPAYAHTEKVSFMGLRVCGPCKSAAGGFVHTPRCASIPHPSASSLSTRAGSVHPPSLCLRNGLVDRLERKAFWQDMGYRRERCEPCASSFVELFHQACARSLSDSPSLPLVGYRVHGFVCILTPLRVSK